MTKLFSKFCPINRGLEQYLNWMGKYRGFTYHSDGSKRSFSKSNILGTLRSTMWDRQGWVIQTSRRKHYRSTSGVHIIREKEYDANGRIVKSWYLKKSVSCFGAKVIKQSVIEYDSRGKRIRSKA